jgi:phosphatidylserine/phosphatidylglycerophosphate/cardiolipin synthase-like enzyme
MISSLLASQLHDEHTFYETFIRDLEACTREVIIESPYITSNRVKMFYPVFERLMKRSVKIYIITKTLENLDDRLQSQSEQEIENFELMGIQPLLCIGNHHRKLAIIDRKILWEGSLNILSQTKSREIMRRIEDEKLTREMFDFLKLSQFI